LGWPNVPPKFDIELYYVQSRAINFDRQGHSLTQQKCFIVKQSYNLFQNQKSTTC
jgi:hypothetical protein